MRESSRRDKIRIMTDLLDIMQEPQRLTRILYKSNMSYVQLVKHLEDLMQMGLAEKVQKPHRSFIITENGKLFMNLVKVNGNYNSHWLTVWGGMITVLKHGKD